jgi:ADP-ribose pyrophosphatase YjhB (NUDIX family)
VDLDPQLWATVQASLPIVCVDAVLARSDAGGSITQVGLIRRFDATGQATTWCHVGGRMKLGESIAEALHRHVSDTVGIDITKHIGPDPQPDYVQQYFTAPQAHPELPDAGVDTRKHAVALSFLVPIDEQVTAVAGSEGLEFAWFNTEQLAALTDVWPGSMSMIGKLLAAAPRSPR